MKKLYMSMVFILVILISSVSAYAGESIEENVMQPIGILSEDKNYAEGINNGEISELRRSIIQDINLDIYLNSGRNLVINARTRCADVSNVVGFKNISLQRWNGSRWVNVITPWDDLNQNVRNHDLGYSRTVEGGYYYKVTLHHYAQQGTGIFADKQEIFNETSYLWVD